MEGDKIMEIGKELFISIFDSIDLFFFVQNETISFRF